MAQISKLAQVLGGLVQNVDLSDEELVLGSVTLGGAMGTELTKAILDDLITNSHAPESDNQTVTAGAGLAGGGSGSSVQLDIELDTDAGLEFSEAGDAGTLRAKVDDATIERHADGMRVKDGGIGDAKVASGIDAAKLADGSVSNTEFQYLDGVTSGIQGQLDGKIAASEKGEANGVATLDANGKLPSSQLTVEAFEYKGTWSADTNTPTLADGTGTTGDLYHVSATGTVDFGAGNIAFTAGDKVVYNGSVWEKWDLTESVISVNGQSGEVELEAEHIPYDNTTSGMTADDVQDAIDELEGRVETLEGADSEAAEGLRKEMIAGEAMAANTSFLVRFALDGETAGRMYKADAAAAVAEGEFYAIGLALKDAAVDAADPVMVTMQGTHALGSSDTPFAAEDIGKPLYLTAEGAFSLTAPSADGSAAYRIGIVQTTSSIWVGPMQLNGIA